MLNRLRELIARWRAGSDERALEEAEQAQREALAGEDYEGRKDDVRIEEYFPGATEE